MSAILYFLLILPLLASTSQTCDWQLTIVSPEVAVPGRAFPVLVTLKVAQTGRRDAANVTLRFISDITDLESQPISETTVAVQDHGIITLQLPKDLSSNVTLQASIDCIEGSIQTLSTIKLVSTVREVIIRPMSKYYKPGEIVFFRVLALDHDLNMASDVTGKVFLSDPAGTKVSVWEEVELNQGVQEFSVPLSRSASEGQWRLGVLVEEELFTYDLNVSLSRGSADPLTPDLVIAEEHFVELRFAPEMRRRYKPGLPFVGKVEALSSERAVRVRVKVLDNATAIYSQDIEMSLGEGTFVVPAILSDSDVITLQAELVSVAGKDTDSHYVLAKEPILKWNSSSSCYLLIEGMERTLQPADTAKATILSSCPCDQDLHYVITTEGHVTYFSQSEILSDEQTPPSVTIDGAAICRINFTFSVEALMAPVSHLLVYYITHNGDPISDVITFDVKLLDKKTTVNLEKKKTWYPGETVDVEVMTEVDSYVCLIGGRGGEVQESKQIESVDFSQAGLQFLQYGCKNGKRSTSPNRIHGLTSERVHGGIMPHGGMEQIWLWKCFNYTSEIEATGVSIPAPPLPGKWSLFALILSPSPVRNLRFSHSVILSVFRPIEVEFKLAPSIHVGESLEVDVKIGNNVNSCVDVNALLSLNEGAHFGGVNQPFVAEKLRLGPQGATSLVVRLIATSAGVKNMSVEVSAFISETCQASSGGTNHQGNHSLVGTVIQSAVITVYSEGLIRTHTESAYFCANEKMIISPNNNFRYEFIAAPRNREGVVFEVRSGGGVSVALSRQQAVSQEMYQVVLGDNDNTWSYISKGKHGYGVHLVSTKTPKILSKDESRTFWVSWESGSISVGRGFVFDKNTILKWKVEKKTRITFIGFASTWREQADFRIWNYNDEAGFSQVLHLDVPRSVLPGSEAGILLVNGGLSLTSILQRGPQSMAEYSSLGTAIANIAPLVFNTSDVGKSAEFRYQLTEKVQNLLAFRLNDSSFGDHTSVPNYWGTLHVLHALAKVQTYVEVDPQLLTSIKLWIQNRQYKDGDFNAYPLELKLDNTTELSYQIQVTVESMATLLDIGVENDADAECVLKARFFLERNVYRVIDACALAMLSYGLVLTKSEMAFIGMDRLKNASTNEEGDFGWPRPPDNSDWLYEEGTPQTNKPVVVTSMKDYKASLYTLMAYTLKQDLKSAEPVARYLFYRSHVLDRHTELAYTAIKAFSMFTKLADDPHRSLTLSLATSGMELTDTLELRPETESQSLPLPSLPTKVFVYATGAGCATVQGQVRYSTYSPPRSNSLLDIYAGVEQEILPAVQDLDGKLPILDIKTCFRWKGPEPSGVIRGEVHMFSGFQLTTVKHNLNINLNFKAYDDKVWFSVANVSSGCATCIRVTTHSRFLVRGLRPALARFYPTNRPDLAVETFFTSPLLTDSDDDYITWFNTHSGPSDEDSQSWIECGVETEKKPLIPDVRLVTDNPDLINEDLTLTDIIIFSDLHSESSTMTPEFEDIEFKEDNCINNNSNTSTTNKVNNITKDIDSVHINEIEHDEEMNKSKVNTTKEITNSIIVTTTERPKEERLRNLKNQSSISNISKGVNASTPIKGKKKELYKSSLKSKTSGELIYISREEVKNNTIKNKIKIKHVNKDEIIISDKPKTEEIKSSKAGNGSVDPKRINHLINTVSELPDKATTKIPPLLETATLAKAISEKVLVVDRKALWGMLRESPSSGENKKNVSLQGG